MEEKEKVGVEEENREGIKEGLEMEVKVEKDGRRWKIKRCRRKRRTKDEERKRKNQ